MPSQSSSTHRYTTTGGVHITRNLLDTTADAARAEVLPALDSRRGLWLASSYEYPGRYTRYDVGFVDPPLAFEARGRSFELTALNARGELLLPACESALRACEAVAELRSDGSARLLGSVPASTELALEEEARTRQPSILSAVRALQALFAAPDDAVLGLYGAFGYDLVFQFEALRMQQPRAAGTRDLVLYVPDRVFVVDHAEQRARCHRYEFEWAGKSTDSLTRETATAAYSGSREAATEVVRDHAPGEFAREVERAKRAFAVGDLFEVTPSQVFTQPCAAPPSALFDTLRRINPAPYGFLINLGSAEYLVGASPEMYVRVQGSRVETCPIAGTIARGTDAIGDAKQILTLLNSEKDAAELTMCTDVDRNDKARICRPGSVRVIGRRQIELYSRLIHTVDHVEGLLRDGYDSLDAFLTHMWAVTVTGAPKLDAMQFIEDHERSPRGYYGGAVGALHFDGSLNTGLTLRTVHITNGIARVRAGATLHFDSEPAAEDSECQLKAGALLSALAQASAPRKQPDAAGAQLTAAAPLRVLVIDHRDSFVHTLADYFRQSGCDVTTLRYGFAASEYDRLAPGLVVLSPGPALPDDFGMRATLAELARRGLPVFGVCLGLQGIVEFCGGRLARLDTPVHGKASQITREESPLFDGLPPALRVGRYHSWYANPSDLPAELQPIARAEPDGCLMALSHRERPWWAVQFHPESILSADGGHGATLIRNVVQLARDAAPGL